MASECLEVANFPVSATAQMPGKETPRKFLDVSAILADAREEEPKRKGTLGFAILLAEIERRYSGA